MPFAKTRAKPETYLRHLAKKPEMCDCEKWTACGCAGMATDPHCMWCCKSLSAEQVAKAIEIGDLAPDYANAKD